jgi:hypothetical protein
LPDSNCRDEAWEWEGETITMVKEAAFPPGEEGDDVNSVRSGGIIRCSMVDNLSMIDLSTMIGRDEMSQEEVNQPAEQAGGEHTEHLSFLLPATSPMISRRG